MEAWLQATIACRERRELQENLQKNKQLRVNNTHQKELEQRVQDLEESIHHLEQAIKELGK